MNKEERLELIDKFGELCGFIARFPELHLEEKSKWELSRLKSEFDKLSNFPDQLVQEAILKQGDNWSVSRTKAILKIGNLPDWFFELPNKMSECYLWCIDNNKSKFLEMFNNSEWREKCDPNSIIFRTEFYTKCFDLDKVTNDSSLLTITRWINDLPVMDEEQDVLNALQYSAGFIMLESLGISTDVLQEMENKISLNAKDVAKIRTNLARNDVNYWKTRFGDDWIKAICLRCDWLSISEEEQSFYVKFKISGDLYDTIRENHYTFNWVRFFSDEELPAVIDKVKCDEKLQKALEFFKYSGDDFATRAVVRSILFGRYDDTITLGEQRVMQPIDELLDAIKCLKKRTFVILFTMAARFDKGLARIYTKDGEIQFDYSTELFSGTGWLVSYFTTQFPREKLENIQLPAKI